MSDVLQFGLLCFVSIFTMVNPLPVVPVFLSMTGGIPPAQARRVAFRASVTALAVMIFFALTGQFIFRFFNISLDAMRIVGGILFFGIGYEMLLGRPTRTKHDEESVAEYAEDIAITPLGTPMLSGPGTITSVILLMNESASLAERGALFGAMLAVAILSYALLVWGQGLLTRLGTSGHKVITRIMGLIVMVIAVEFFFAGLRGMAKGIVLGGGAG